jgi:hypothetical protein
VKGNRLDSLWRIVAVMLNTICIAPQPIEKLCILLSPGDPDVRGD